MKWTTLFLVMNALFINVLNAQTFEQQQLRYSRVRTAKAETDAKLKKMFEDKGLKYPCKDLYFRAFKADEVFEVWGRDKSTDAYTLVTTYEICDQSGELGPKRQQGDMQVPEGLYKISYYNPSSTFYLSLKVNYPNKSDRILGVKSNLGGDIFVHGDCVTIGCIPLTNKIIKELYWMSVRAFSLSKKNIPIDIFPTKMTAANYEQLVKIMDDENHTNEKLWSQLQKAYLYFEKHKKRASYSIDAKGNYIINS